MEVKELAHGELLVSRSSKPKFDKQHKKEATGDSNRFLSYLFFNYLTRM